MRLTVFRKVINFQVDKYRITHRRLGNENKSSFHSLLFCVSLGLHYLCTIKHKHYDVIS